MQYYVCTVAVPKKNLQICWIDIIVRTIIYKNAPVDQEQPFAYMHKKKWLL